MIESEIRHNRSKIVATVGPASNSKETLTKLVEAGVNVFRLNFSHGTHEDHAKVIAHVREINKELNTSVALLQDLQGPKIRVGKVEGNAMQLNDGDHLTISVKEVLGKDLLVSTTYKSLVNDVNAGDAILMDDGNLSLKVIEKNSDQIVTEVIHGGILKSNKGINLPYTKVSAPCLTEKDLIDLKFGIENDMDWIALSFVRTAEDVKELKDIIAESGKKIKVISKIEKPEALECIDEIIEETDGLMVARGDLGVEIRLEDVPMIQKMLVTKCNKAFKPVIIATQMMESMIENFRPTRAEANDIANAVLDGADALMLSAETAAGKYPVEVVQTMDRTIASVESRAKIYYDHYVLDQNSPTFNNDNLVLIACRLAKRTYAKALIGITNSGFTASKIAGHRPKSHIFIFTPNRKLLHQLSLVWGVRAYYYDKVQDSEATFTGLEKLLKGKGLLQSGDVIINTGSLPVTKGLRTNMLKIDTVE